MTRTDECARGDGGERDKRVSRAFFLPEKTFITFAEARMSEEKLFPSSREP